MRTVQVEFAHYQEERSTGPLGPFEYVQVTYTVLRAEPIGGSGDPPEIAYFDPVAETWTVKDHEGTFSDVIIAPWSNDGDGA